MFLEIECPKIAEGILRIIRARTERPDPAVDAEYDVGLGWRFFPDWEEGDEAGAHCPMGLLSFSTERLPHMRAHFEIIDDEVAAAFTDHAVACFARWWDSVPEDALEAGIDAVWGER